MATNLHYDRIRCPICVKPFGSMASLENHQMTKGHYLPHLHPNLHQQELDAAAEREAP
jgi:hypothetical protein